MDQPPTTVEEYIRGFEPPTRRILRALRKAIRERAPDATEAIRYGMPTFRLKGNLVHFAAYARHIGFYPTSSAIDAFKHELARYKCGRGTVQFPIDDPLPLDLIRRMVEYRVAECRQSAATRKKARRPRETPRAVKSAALPRG